jgi:nucleotide-binding universal stress UspA family protein
MYEKILVTLDGSSLAECVLPHVETIIKGCAKPEVILLQVVEPIPMIYGYEVAVISPVQIQQMEEKDTLAAEKYLKGIVKHLESSGAQVKSKVLYGRAAESIADYIKNNGPDLLIIATHGRSGVSRWVRGSVADRILHIACIAILMVQAPNCGLAYKK